MGCWWEAVLTVRFPVCVVLCCNNSMEVFCILQTRCKFTEESCESGVVLWHGFVKSCVLFQVSVLPLAETAGRALVFLQQERCRNNLR